MGQKDGEKWSAAVDSQPTLPKPDRRLAPDAAIDANVCRSPRAVTRATWSVQALSTALLESCSRHGIAGREIIDAAIRCMMQP